MSFEIRAIRLLVTTASGEVGFERRLDESVIVVRGGNTVGKSLLLQAVLFGLGAEALFATRKGVLTRAMTSEIDLDTTEEVQSSYVDLVVRNEAGSEVTIRRAARTVAGNASETDLVQIWDGDVWDDNNRGPSVDYLTARGGSAVEARGFHRFLAEFGGLSLPQVPTYQQRFVPLYLQVVLGLSYVDQKRGWGGIVPQVPTTFQIVEPLRRAVEYVLDLDVLNQSTSRQELVEEEARLREQESRLRGRLEAVAALHGGRVVLPTEVVIGVSEVTSAPAAEVLIGNEWTRLADRIERLQQARRDRALRDVLGDREQPAGFEDLERQLGAAESDLAANMARLEALNADEGLIDVQLGALGRRLGTLDEELRRYGQLVALHNLGSVIAPHSIEDGDCPTCHQSLEHVESIEGNALPVEETREALRQDRQTVRALISEAEERLALLEARRHAWTEDIRALRLKVRALRSDLTAATGTPSTTIIQQAVEEEQELARLATLEASFLEDADEWSRVARQWSVALASLKDLGRLGWSSSDVAKVGTWTSSLQGLLADFDFSSSKPSDVGIDEGMKPVVDGYDIGFQGSASDGIRLRWAYLLSLLETSVRLGGNHPGLLLMDEPGQQGVETESLASMYRHVASTTSAFGQIFLTTSVPIETIDEWMGATPRTVIDLGTEPLLKRL